MMMMIAGICIVNDFVCRFSVATIESSSAWLLCAASGGALQSSPSGGLGYPYGKQMTAL